MIPNISALSATYNKNGFNLLKNKANFTLHSFSIRKTWD